MKREELVKLEARLKLMGYSCDNNPLNGKRNWIKHIDKGQNPSATIRYYIWINENSETGEERIMVEANGRVTAIIGGYKYNTEVISRIMLDPGEMWQNVYQTLKSYRNLLNIEQ